MAVKDVSALKEDESLAARPMNSPRALTPEQAQVKQIQDRRRIVGFATDDSEIQSLNARSNLRRGIQDARLELPDMQEQERQTLQRDADSALSQGLGNTRRNFNQRGLLYSGLRQGGEQNLRSQVASTLAGQTQAVNRDYGKRADALNASEASLGLAAQREALARQEAVFDQTLKNQVARRQALQQLGQGAGYAMGALYGSRTTPETSQNQAYTQRRDPGVF